MRAAALAAVLVVGGAGPAAATGPAVRAQQPVQPLCAPGDPELAELSGLAADGRSWFAVSDGGTALRVAVLDPADCRVVDTVTASVDPYDVEDLALAADGALWLADTGDNDLDRPTVALHRLQRDGSAALFRLAYPDGPHDAEALLLDRAGVPHLVTKDPFGAAGVYRPAGPLTAPGPTPLERVGTVRFGPTGTPGGPVGSAGSVVVTGGATSVDGTVVALRTYTDAHLFAAPGGDVVAALAGTPVVVPLPGEPQGEAVALAPDGTLLSGSEAGADGSPAPLRSVPGAAALVAPAAAPPAAPPSATAPAGADAAPAPGGAGLPPWQAAAVAAAVTAGVVLLARRRRAE